MKKLIGLLGLLCVAGGLAVATLVIPTKASPPGSTTSITAAIYGHFDYSIPGWTGYAFVSFGNQPPKEATVACHGTPPMTKNNGVSFYGTERNVLTFTDGSGTLELNVNWDGVPTSAPRAYAYHAVGTAGNGTGVYSQVTGSVSSQGSFILPVPPVSATPPVWITQVHGAVQGLNP